MDLFSKLGGRRFVLAVGAGLVSSLLLWFTKLTSGDFALIVIGTVGAYIAGATIEQANLDKQSRRTRSNDTDNKWRE